MLYLWDSVGGKGKTEWARSLGKHVYLCGQLDIKGQVWKDAEYAILDDTCVRDIKAKGMWKGLASGQKVLTLRDLHFKKAINWGKPCIMLANHSPPPMVWDEWDEEHVVVIELKENLY